MTRFKYILVCFIFFISCNKNNHADYSLHSDTNDSVKSYLNKIENSDISEIKKIALNDKALSIVNDVKNDSIRSKFILSIATNYFKFKDLKKFHSSSLLMLNNSKRIKDTSNIAKSYVYLAEYFKRISKNDSAFYFYLKAEKFYGILNDSESLGDVYIRKADVQSIENNFLGSVKSASEALSILKKFNTNLKKIYEAYNLIGISSNELKNYDQALEYHKKALKTAKESNLPDKDYLVAISLNNIGNTYQDIGKNSDAIKYFNEALLDNNLSSTYPSLYATLLDNLAYSRYKIKNFENLPDLFYKSLKIREDNDFFEGIIINKIHLSEYYYSRKEIQNSKKNALEAYLLSKKIGSTNNILFSLKQLSIVDTINSADYSSSYIKISDSLQQAERKSQEKFARIAYETDEIIQEKSSLEEKNRNLLYIFVVSFIVVVLLFVVRAQRARTRELLYKQAQQKANEDIYNLMMSQQAIIDESRNKEKKRLAQDLHDGVLGRMFGLRLNLDSLNYNNDEESIKKRFELLNELKTIEQDIREISHDLNREKQVLINNFVSIVHNLLEEQKSSHDANLIYTIDNSVDWDKISNNIKINMYRILQEGLQNINKYANAKTITVEVKGDKENVYLKIQDDGVGFDVNRKSKGIGMQNMISRTNDCQGIIDITSKKDHGTKIVITLPIETKQQPITEQA